MIRIQGLAVVLFFVVFIAPPQSLAQARVFPEPPILLEPGNEAILLFPGTQTPIQFSWQPVQGATRYEVNIRVGNIPRPPAQTTATVASIDLGLTLNNRNSAVFWSVRAGNADGFSNQVSSASFIFGENGIPIPGQTPFPTLSPTPIPRLAAPKLIEPKDGASIDYASALSIAFDWSDVTGASRYRLRVYQDNVALVDRELDRSRAIGVRVETVVLDTFQWDVQAFALNGNPGILSQRNSFIVGEMNGFPTPTPLPISADMNKDGAVNASDVFLFASLFRTNDPNVDINNSGINDASDMLEFLRMFATRP